jgi:prephenate dehydrogenase
VIERVLIIGTGLIGASVGLALRSAGFSGRIDGWDQSSLELKTAVAVGALDGAAGNEWGALELARQADVIVLAVPVLAIKDWMEKLVPVTGAGQLITDVGSTKLEITEIAAKLFPAGSNDKHAVFLAGHPMAGKESGGAMLAEATLFNGAMWLFTPANADATPIEKEWRMWVGLFGTRTLDMEPKRHDEMCAWVSHLRPRSARDHATGRKPLQHVARRCDDQHRADRRYAAGAGAETDACAGEPAHAGAARRVYAGQQVSRAAAVVS